MSTNILLHRIVLDATQEPEYRQQRRAFCVVKSNATAAPITGDKVKRHNMLKKQQQTHLNPSQRRVKYYQNDFIGNPRMDGVRVLAHEHHGEFGEKRSAEGKRRSPE